MSGYHLIQMPHQVLIALPVPAHSKRVQIECRLQDVFVRKRWYSCKLHTYKRHNHSTKKGKNLLFAFSSIELKFAGLSKFTDFRGTQVTITCSA
jgi:hypothetical protein